MNSIQLRTKELPSNIRSLFPSLRSYFWSIQLLIFRTVVVYDKPEETCNLESFKTCQFVTKLVPNLKDREECVGEYWHFVKKWKYIWGCFCFRYPSGNMRALWFKSSHRQQTCGHNLVLQGVSWIGSIVIYKYIFQNSCVIVIVSVSYIVYHREIKAKCYLWKPL